MKALIILLIGLFAYNAFAETTIEDCAEGESFLEELKECVVLSASDEETKAKIEANTFLSESYSELKSMNDLKGTGKEDE